MKKVTVERTYKVKSAPILPFHYIGVETVSITPAGRKALEEAKAKKG